MIYPIYPSALLRRLSVFIRIFNDSRRQFPGIVQIYSLQHSLLGRQSFHSFLDVYKRQIPHQPESADRPVDYYRSHEGEAHTFQSGSR